MDVCQPVLDDARARIDAAGGNHQFQFRRFPSFVHKLDRPIARRPERNRPGDTIPDRVDALDAFPAEGRALDGGVVEPADAH